MQFGGYEDLDNFDTDSSVLTLDQCTVFPSKVEFKSARSISNNQVRDSTASQPHIEPCNQHQSIALSDENATSIQDLQPSGTVQGFAPESPPTWTLVQELQSEINFLRQSLKQAEDKEKLPAKMTIRKIIMGEDFSLESYRSKEDKLELLDEALNLHDGNAIITAVLFLRNSTESHIFNHELLLRPVAVEHYISFLRQSRLYDDLVRLLQMLRRTEEAALLNYKLAISQSRSAQEKFSNIQNCYRNCFQSDKALAIDASLINDQIRLLPTQLQIRDYDTKNAAQVFRTYPCSASVVGTSVITTLFYCCLYHYQMPETSLSSPLSISKSYQLTEKQFQWTALRARSQLRHWKDIEKLFETKGFLGGMKMKATMGFDRVVAHFSRLNVPREVFNKYCDLIDGLDRRLEVGIQFHCHKSVIDTCVQLRDRNQLLSYQSQLLRGSRDWTYANDILNTSSIKWKN